MLNILDRILSVRLGHAPRVKLGGAGGQKFCLLNRVMWHTKLRERSCSVVECLTLDRGAADLSLTSITVLCP